MGWLSIGIFICASFSYFIDADFNCTQAPDSDMEQTCHMLQEWDSAARKAIRKRQVFRGNVGAPGVAGFQPANPPRFAPSAQGCMNIACICPYMGGRMANGCILPNGQPYLMSYRKEYRMMSDNERMRWHNAMMQLKRSGEYDRLSVMHRQVGSASGAHSGPGFLPWHREYMKRMEIALRLIDPGISMPYWDSVLESYLPDPRDSIMFSPQFMGMTDASGQLVSGPFAGFRTLEGRPNIIRRMATEGKMFTEQNINNLMTQNDIVSVMAFTAPQGGCPFRPYFGALEYTHASIHLWMGGDMKPPSTSANDPIFFLHHTFVDFIWEMWRQNHQNRFTRESQYPPDIAQCANAQHFSYAQMRPWDKINRDGLSNAYTDNLYHYAPRPTCNRNNAQCGSPYLFCDTRGNPHCVAKIKPGGLCRGFEGLDACYMGSCVAGWCRGGEQFQQPAQTTALIPQQPAIQPQQPAAQAATTARPAVAAATPRPPAATPRPAATPQSNCYNEDPCCAQWSRQNECRTNTAYMNRYCRKSCGFCTNPSDNQRGCHDRHLSCGFWRSQNFCTRRRQWMAENCQASCGWCNLNEAQLCQHVARMSRRIRRDNSRFWEQQNDEPIDDVDEFMLDYGR
ncbi:unnamed protein product [Caenorhabditis angaria]|uniref:ShKT domain-containing protein n=1 Tax=Caenorhabditis angaria TaxID=860376 RepID=A0A9P1MZB0_9PELO|nr:unnamed protein product [Caenorhabditis angaria]